MIRGDCWLFYTESGVMKLEPPPSEYALKAAIDFYRSHDDRAREVFDNAKLDPFLWWTTSKRYKARCEEVFGVREFRIAIEYEHATVHGDIGAYSWACSKSYGDLIRIRPVEPGDPYDELFNLVQHKESSPWRQKWTQRDNFKKRLHKKDRPIVNFARKSTWQDFRSAVVGGDVVYLVNERSAEWQIRFAFYHSDILSVRKTETGKTVRAVAYHAPDPRWSGCEKRIKAKLGCDLKTFWRACKGKEFIELPKVKKQKQLF